MNAPASSAFRWMGCLLLGAVLWLIAGCATPEPENASARPWNTPRGWEGGLPTSLREGR